MIGWRGVMSALQEIRNRIAIGQFSELTDERLTFAEQLGVSGVQLNTPAISGERGYWEYSDLKSLKDKAEDRGLRLEALENVPIHFYDKAMLGLPGWISRLRIIRQQLPIWVKLVFQFWVTIGCLMEFGELPRLVGVVEQQLPRLMQI